MALNDNFGIVFPVVFGIGTGLPVIVFAAAIAFGVFAVLRWLKPMTKAKKTHEKVYGSYFLVIGAYSAWNYIVLSILK